MVTGIPHNKSQIIFHQLEAFNVTLRQNVWFAFPVTFTGMVAIDTDWITLQIYCSTFIRLGYLCYSVWPGIYLNENICVGAACLSLCVPSLGDEPLDSSHKRQNGQRQQVCTSANGYFYHQLIYRPFSYLTYSVFGLYSVKNCSLIFLLFQPE